MTPRGTQAGHRCALRRGLAAHALAAGLALGASFTAAPARAQGAPPDTAAFTLFAWVSPPADSTNFERVAEMAALSLDLMLPAWLDQGWPADNLARLDWAAANGMRCLIWDRRFDGALQWLPTFEDTLDDIVADYRDHPGLWGYYMGDEPQRGIWPLLARLREALRTRDPRHPMWNNLYGRASFSNLTEYDAQLRDYCELLNPAVLCADHYDLLLTSDRGLFVENAVQLRRVADDRGIPFWDIIQLIPHGPFRPLQHGEMRWQVAQLLAYGARGIGYFTYWTPDPEPGFNWDEGILDNDGHRTPWYDFLLDFNASVRVAGRELARTTWRRTTHAGSIPVSGVGFTPGDWIAAVEGRATIGEFTGTAGERRVLVANADSLAPRTVTLTLTAPASVRVLASGAAVAVPAEPLGWNAEASLGLAAGDFALLVLDPLPSPPARLVLAPNPARGAVRFAAAASGPGGTLEILDLSGRPLWSAPLSASQPVVTWRGELGAGGRARPGLYFVRVRGVPGAAARFVWLGER